MCETVAVEVLIAGVEEDMLLLRERDGSVLVAGKLSARGMQGEEEGGPTTVVRAAVTASVDSSDVDVAARGRIAADVAVPVSPVLGMVVASIGVVLFGEVEVDSEVDPSDG